MVFRLQGAYYFFTGIWPLIHIGSFMAVTGEKTDIWLVKMVGCLSIAIGVTLFFGKNESQKILAISTAVAFMGIDLYYSLAKIISPIYLLDAFVQLAFVVWIILYSVQAQRRRSL